MSASGPSSHRKFQTFLLQHNGITGHPLFGRFVFPKSFTGRRQTEAGHLLLPGSFSTHPHRF